MAKPILHYFKGRGRAETIRLMLTAAGVEWEDAPYLTQPEQMEKLRNDGLLVFGQVPLLQWEGKNLVQAMAIVRYIAHKYNLRGKSVDESFRIDMLAEGARDFLGPFFTFRFMPDDQFKKNITTAIDRYMPIFNKELIANKNGFLVGDCLSMADVCLFEVLLQVKEQTPEKCEPFPEIQKFVNKMKEMPNFAKYLANDKRFPPNTEQYVKEVKTTLKW